MHYKSGEEARLGDIVRGIGYNVKREIEGIVVGLTPGADTCNLQVAHLSPNAVYPGNMDKVPDPSPSPPIVASTTWLERLAAVVRFRSDKAVTDAIEGKPSAIGNL